MNKRKKRKGITKTIKNFKPTTKKTVIYPFLAVALVVILFISVFLAQMFLGQSNFLNATLTGNAVLDINKGVTAGDFVLVDYIGYLGDETVFETSIKEEAEKAGIYSPSNIYQPLQFQVGSKQVIEGIEKGIVGMVIWEEKEIELQPKDAYGDYNTQLVMRIPKDKLPPGQELKPGMVLPVKTPEGTQIPGKITELTEKEVILDLNHPLAGKTLKLKLILVNISNESFVMNSEDIKTEGESANCPDTIEGNISAGLKIKYFYSPFCPWCIKEEPILERLVKGQGNLFKLERYDIRYCLEEVVKYQVSGTPTFVFSIEDGAKEFVQPGFIEEDKLKETICGISGGC